MPTKSIQRILFSASLLIFAIIMVSACSAGSPNKTTVDAAVANTHSKPPLQSVSPQMSESQISHNRLSGSAKTKAGTLIINSPKVTVGNAPKPTPIMPKRGASMEDVITEFGTPNKKLGPIGKPPISRWFYNDFKVVFEYKHVIQSVANQ